MVRLNLGSGDHYEDGWVNVDLPGNGVRVDVAHDITERLPFDDGSVDKVYLGHVLEHVDYDLVVAVLGEVRRVLVPGGDGCIVGPDVGNTLRLGMKNILNIVLYGASRWPGDEHMWTSTGEAHYFAARLAGFDARLVMPDEVPDGWPVVSRAPWQFAVLLTKP